MSPVLKPLSTKLNINIKRPRQETWSRTTWKIEISSTGERRGQCFSINEPCSATFFHTNLGVMLFNCDRTTWTSTAADIWFVEYRAGFNTCFKRWVTMLGRIELFLLLLSCLVPFSYKNKKQKKIYHSKFLGVDTKWRISSRRKADIVSCRQKNRDHAHTQGLG